jgi:UTP--glucose-1-phosphate uridylyltransferase
MKIRKAVIPCAGLGTRFLPATKATPKEMLPIIDIPMIQYIVEEAVAAGIEDIVFITGRNKDSIVDHFDYSFEVESTLDRKGKSELADVSRRIAKLCNIMTIRQKNPMGLGHAVLCAEPVIGEEPFAVLLGDDLIDAKIPCIRQLIDVAEREKASVVGVMEVAESEVSKYGIIGGDRIDARLTRVKTLVEKPSPAESPSRLAIPGRYVLTPGIFEVLRKTTPGKGGEIQLTDGLKTLAEKESLFAYAFEGIRYDTGDRIGYIDATLAYAMKRPELAPAVRRLMKKHLEFAGGAS